MSHSDNNSDLEEEEEEADEDVPRQVTGPVHASTFETILKEYAITQLPAADPLDASALADAIAGKLVAVTSANDLRIILSSMEACRGVLDRAIARTSRALDQALQAPTPGTS